MFSESVQRNRAANREHDQGRVEVMGKVYASAAGMAVALAVLSYAIYLVQSTVGCYRERGRPQITYGTVQCIHIRN